MKRVLFLPILFAAACGGEATDAPAMHVGFRAHALKCDVADIEAKLQIAFVDEECPLTVNEDRTVEGTCPAVPTGSVRDFRLIYFKMLPGDPVPLDLASAIETADLRSVKSSPFTLSFNSVDTDIDDDGDNASNIVEVCEGKNPRGI